MNNTKSALLSNSPMFFAMMFLGFIMAWPQVEEMLAENRWYKDMRGLTPFSLVEVTQSEVIDGGIVVHGVLRKDRCDVIVDLIRARVQFEGKASKRTTVDTSPEDQITGLVGVSRAPSEEVEVWGPWVIRWEGEKPDGWRIFVTHDNCPTPPYEQTNLFASGPWADVTPEE
jgi:hypothetical protein